MNDCDIQGKKFQDFNVMNIYTMDVMIQFERDVIVNSTVRVNSYQFHSMCMRIQHTNNTCTSI